MDVPWWSVDDESQLCHREGKIAEGGDEFRCETIDYGQVVGYTCDRLVETAKNAIAQVGSRSKHGFGELPVKSVEPRANEGSPEEVIENSPKV